MSPTSSPSPSPEPLSLFSEDLVPIRQAKTAGQTSLSFDNLLQPPLLLHEDLKEGCGGQLWPAGMVLAKFLLKDLDLIRGKIVLELGAGGGLVGLALARALLTDPSPSPSPSQPPIPILITDLPVLLPLQQKNIADNGLPDSAILSSELAWGLPLPSTLPTAYRNPDVILAADCVYFEPAFPLLLETLGELLDDGAETESRSTVDGWSARKKPICYFCMKKRRKADMRFIAVLKKRFDVQDLGEDVREEVREEGGGIFLYRVQRKGEMGR